MCAGYAATIVAGELGRRGDIEAFELASPDVSLWSQTRLEQFRSSMRLATVPPIGILRASSLELEVPIYPKLDELHLNRGVALIDGMSMPNEGGNVGVAGHRDGFFRVLKDIRRDDVIELQTRAGTHRYRVASVSVVDISDRELLKDTEEPTLTLVTCYPFYHVGQAPQRFVVRGEYLWNQSLDARRQT
jgi:sortase A